MQDKYAGDIGDFGKYGLLRWLCGDRGDGRQLRLGVIWYYVATDGQLPPLGNAFTYLFNPSPAEQRLVECDSELIEILRRLINQSQRSVADVEQSDVLPADTVYFRDEVPADAGERLRWFALAANLVGECDLVFLDPDNGLSGNAGQQFATYDEAAQLYGAGKSLVIYQSFGRVGAGIEIQQHAVALRRELGIDGPLGEIIALRFRRRFARVFFVIPNPDKPDVADLLRERVASFMASPWGTGRDPHFTCVNC